MTIGVTAFSLAPLQNITSNANAIIAAQEQHVQNSNASANTKALWNVQLNQLKNPGQYGLIEIVGFPGFFTAKCEYLSDAIRLIL